MSNYDFSESATVEVPVNKEVAVAFGDAEDFTNRSVALKMPANGSNLTLHTFTAPEQVTIKPASGSLILVLTGSNAPNLRFSVTPVNN